MHASTALSLSNVSMFLTIMLATWLVVTDSSVICGTSIVLSSTSEYRSPMYVGLLKGGWTEYGLSRVAVGGGFEWSLNPVVGVVAAADFVRLLVVSLFARSCIGRPMLTYACWKLGLILGCCPYASGGIS